MHLFVLGRFKLGSFLYPFRQLYHVRRVDAEEDIQDFCQFRSGLDSLQVVVFFLGSERAFHRCCPHSGEFPADKVLLLFLLREWTASFHERRLYPIRLAVVPVLCSGIACISANLLRFNPEQPLVHLEAVNQTRALVE